MKDKNWLVEQLQKKDSGNFDREWNRAINFAITLANELVEEPDVKADNVNHPQHYKQGSQEVIEIIEDTVKHYPRSVGYHIGNTIKYIMRAPFKNKMVEDLEKAQWYLNRALDQLN